MKVKELAKKTRAAKRMRLSVRPSLPQIAGMPVEYGMDTTIYPAEEVNVRKLRFQKRDGCHKLLEERNALISSYTAKPIRISWLKGNRSQLRLLTGALDSGFR